MDIMKTSLKLFLTAIVAMAAFSCAKETEVNTEAPVAKKTITLTATVDDNIVDATETKTYLDGLNILWNGDETVKAYGTLNYDSESISVSLDKKTADFTFDVDPGDEIHYAIYPAANANDDDEDNMEVTIPTVQTATAGSFDPAAMAAIGRVQDGGKIAFMNVGALLSIVINNDDIESVEITATEANTESMTGTATIEIDGSDNITTVTDGSTTSVKLTGGLDNGETYYFVVYPGTYSNLRIVVTKTDGAIAVYRNKTSFTVNRNENWKIADLTISSGKWQPAKVEYQYLYESFDKCNGTGGNDDSWSGSVAGATTTSDHFDLSGWTSTGTIYKGKECVRLGAGSANGDITTPALAGIPASSTLKIRFRAGAWNGDGTTLSLTVTGGGAVSPTSVTLNNAEFKDFEVTGTNLTAYSKIKFSTNSKRFFFDEFEVVGEVSRDDSPKNFTVTYNANTGSGDAPVDGTTYNDQTNFIVTVLGQGELSKTGHNFNGWNTAADGSGTAYTEGSKFVISANTTLYAQWSPIDYDITANTNSHGTYTVKIGGSDVTTGQYGQTLSIATSSVEAGYAFNKFVVSYTDSESVVHTANLTTNPAAYTMPAYPISISMVLDVVTTYTVSLYSNGAKVKDVVVSENAYLLTELDGEEDALTGPAGKSFLGWSTSNVPASITYITASTKATASINLYAVFGDEAKYQLVESDLAGSWAGDYLIAYDDNTFADGRTGGTSGMGAQNRSVAPGTNLSGKIVKASWGDTYSVTLEEVSSGSDTYLMITKDGQYNYQTNNSNGLASTATRATAANYPLSISFTSSSDIDISIVAGAVFHYNTQGYFRFYKNAGQSSVYLYKRQAGEELLTW